MKIQLRWLLPSILILVFLALAPPKAYAQTEFLYANDNQSNAPNTVSAFSIGHDGTLTPLQGSPYFTGANGSTGFDVIDVNNSIQVRGKFLFVANISSISVFTIDPIGGALSLVPGSPFDVAGTTSSWGIALTVSPDNRLLFAGDARENQLSVFTIAPDGKLKLLPESPFAVEGEPLDMKVTRGNKFLIIALGHQLGQTIGAYKISPSGELAPIPGSPFPYDALGIDVNCKANLLFATRALPEVGVLHIADDGFLAPIPGSPFVGPGTAYVALALNPVDKFLYVNDGIGIGAVVSFFVADDGSLTPVHRSPLPPNTQVTGLVPDEDNKFLFVAGGLIPEEIFSFAVGPNGNLTVVPGSPFLTGESGTVTSLATFPGKDCP